MRWRRVGRAFFFPPLATFREKLVQTKRGWVVVRPGPGPGLFPQQLSQSANQRSSEPPDECEALVNLQGWMKGRCCRRRMSAVTHICAEGRIQRRRSHRAFSKAVKCSLAVVVVLLRVLGKLLVLLTCDHLLCSAQPAQRAQSTWTTTSPWCVSGSWWAWPTLPPCSA